MFALGISNIVGSFFQCFVSSGALARTAVYESSGGRTQLVTLIASCIIALVLLFLSPLLEALPKACLGSIIIAALINLFKQFKDLDKYWKLDKIDFIIWIVTFLSSILIDIDYGLCVGVLMILFINTYRFQTIKVLQLGQIKDYKIYSDLLRYKVNNDEKIKIIMPTKALNYLNCDEFQAKLKEICPLKESSKEKKSLKQNVYFFYDIYVFYINLKINLILFYYKCYKKLNCEWNVNVNLNDENDFVNLNKIDKTINLIIIDFTSVEFIDEMAVKCLQNIISLYEKENVRVLFANCNS